LIIIIFVLEQILIIMKIKSIALILSLLGLFSISAYAGGPDPRTLKKDIGVTAGVYSPLHGNLGTGVYMGVNYATFFNSGIGFRFGMDYIASVANTADVVDAPVAFVYRTRGRSTQERFMSGAYGAAHSLMYDIFYGNRENVGSGMIAAALANLFSGAEYYAGITPGLLTTESYYAQENAAIVESSSPLSLTLDAGMNLNYAIWRFDLKFMPAFHYYLTNNYKTRTMDTITSDYYLEPVRWFFSFGVGLNYRF